MKHFFTLLSLLGIIFSFHPKPSYAQKEFYNWYFGDSAGVSYMTGSPVVFLSSKMWAPSGGSCNISDSLGSILFYSDFINVYNRHNVVMPNGWLNGSMASMSFVKQTIAFRQLNDHSKYFIFYTGLGGSPPGFLRYSVIDMNLDGGLGDLPAAQNGLPVPGGYRALHAVTATCHHNNHDVWVVVRLASTDSNYYSSYLVNSAGLNATPVFSNSHLLLPTNANWGIQCIKISRDGTKLAAAYDHAVEFCNFNTTTGKITPLFLVHPPQCSGHDLQPISAEFSIDSKYLYVSAAGGTACASRYFLYQYDATITDSTLFLNSATLLSNENRCHMLQLAPDGKIYGSSSFNQTSFVDSLCAINNPSFSGAACNYQSNVLSLQGRGSRFALPDYVERYYALIYDNVPCLTRLVNFTSAVWPPADTIRWDFGDGMQSSLPNPSHMFLNTGSYTVELYVRHNDNRTDTTRMVINILLKPDLGPDRTVCLRDSATFDAGACPGGSFLWKNLGTGATVGTSQKFKAGQAGTYAVYVTNPNNCVGSDTVQLMTTPVPVITNTPPLVKTICSGESTNIALTSNPAGAMFHWTATLTSGNVTGYSADSGLVINQVLTDQLASPGTVTYHITPKVGSCAGQTVDFLVTVNPLDSVKVSINASGNNVCSGTSVTCTASPTYGGSTPAYQWKVNGINAGTNSPVFTYTPINNDVVKCVMTSSVTGCITNNPATSNTITMTVNPLKLVSVSIAPSLNPVCAGNSVTFTASPVNGGSPPSYQWKVNGVNAGTNNQVYSYIPANGDIVTCILNSNVACATGNPATSNPVTMTVTPNLVVSVAVTASQNPFCAGGAVMFTATPGNGGVPQYQWKVNGANTGTNSNTYTYNPVNGDQVMCTMNSSIPCPLNNPATSNTVNMIENTNLPAGLSITAIPNPFCPGSTVNYTATPSNGGSLPIYQWKVNGSNQGANAQTFSYTPQAGDSIRCVITSNLPCVTNNPASSDKIIMSALPAPLVSFPFCFDSITTISAAPYKLKGGIPLGGTYSGPGINTPTSVFTPSLAGTGTKTITYSYTNVSSCSTVATRNIIVLPAPVFNCGSNLTDIRDNKVYPTIQIGPQCWMQKNLDYGNFMTGTTEQTDNCINEKYCYGDNAANCGLYGGLYQWDEVMAYTNTPGTQGLCPPGWHVPTQAEWMLLFNNSLTQGMAGKPLQDSIFNGFRAKDIGVDYSNISWKFQGFATIFWSSNSYGAIKALSHGMNLQNFGVSDYYSNRSNAFAVRCLKD